MVKSKTHHATRGFNEICYDVIMRKQSHCDISVLKRKYFAKVDEYVALGCHRRRLLVLAVGCWSRALMLLPSAEQETKYQLGERSVEMTFVKEGDGWWPHVQRERCKLPWLKVHWPHRKCGDRSLGGPARGRNGTM